MNIDVKCTEGGVLVLISGRLDTNTAPELEGAIANFGQEDITFDCAGMEYISSAGLRVLLATHKQVTAKGHTFTLRNITPEVRSVLDMTGFSKILTIE